MAKPAFRFLLDTVERISPMPHPSHRSTTRRRRPSQLLGAGLALVLVFALASPASAKKKDEDKTSEADIATKAQDLGGALSLFVVAEAIGATELWEQGITGDGVDVAVAVGIAHVDDPGQRAAAPRLRRPAGRHPPAGCGAWPPRARFSSPDSAPVPAAEKPPACRS